MALPEFTDANVNSYLAGIVNDGVQLQQLAQGLGINFLQALTTHFDVNSWQEQRINGLVPGSKRAVTDIA